MKKAILFLIVAWALTVPAFKYFNHPGSFEFVPEDMEVFVMFAGPALAGLVYVFIPTPQKIERISSPLISKWYSFSNLLTFGVILPLVVFGFHFLYTPTIELAAR